MRLRSWLGITFLGIVWNAHADEGMFYRFQIPYTKINAAYPEIQLTPEKIERVSRSVLKVLIGSSGSGSASIVSPDGLVLTNAHIVRGCVQDLRSQHQLPSLTPEQPFASGSFFADSSADELPCETYQFQRTEWVKDVTDQVVARLPKGTSKEEKDVALQNIEKELVSICEGLSPDLPIEELKKKQDELSHVCQLTSLTSIERFFLERLEVFRDVRLVYAPSEDLGSFGGDRLNFQYPRHATDFAFLRAYGNSKRKICDSCEPYGQVKEVPNETTRRIEKRFKANETNEPLDTSDRFLVPELNTPVQDNDFVMLMGYPGNTSRLRSHFSIGYRQTQQHPFTIAFYSALERTISARIVELAEATDEKLVSEREELKDTQAAIMNNILGEQAVLDGLIKTRLLEKKIDLDQRLQTAIANHPEFTEKYGHVLGELETIYQTLAQNNPALTWLPLVGSSGIFGVAWKIVSVVEGLDPQSPNPTPPTLQRGLKKLKADLMEEAQQQPTDVAESIEVLATALGIHQEDAFDIPFLGALVQDIAGHEKLTPQELATNLVRLHSRGTRVFTDNEFRQKLLSGTYEELVACNDPAIVFARQIKAIIRPLQKQNNAVFSEILSARGRYYEAIQAVLGEGGMDYYDANVSERFTYGRVMGYTEVSGEQTTPVTITTTFGDIFTRTLNGVLLTDLYTEAEKEFAKKAAEVFGDAPVNFVSTLDITGGNSGSAVLNKDLHVVGTAFDSNWVGVVRDYVYDETQGRTVSVSLPLAVQYMNQNASGGLEVPGGKSKPNWISQELEAAVRGESSWAPEPPTFLHPRDPGAAAPENDAGGQ